MLLSLGVAGALPSFASAEGTCEELAGPEHRERVKPPRKKKGVALLSQSELERWGPIQVMAVIDCEGRVVQVAIEKGLPEEIEQKLRSNLSRWRYRPATLDREPVSCAVQSTARRWTTASPGSVVALVNQLHNNPPQQSPLVLAGSAILVDIQPRSSIEARPPAAELS